MDHYELFWNDTTATPYIVDASTTAATFSAVDPTALGSVNSEVFLNNSTVAEAEQIPGMLTGQWNVLYARAVDQSDAKSGFAPSDSVFIKPVRSNILMVNAYSGGGDPVSLQRKSWAPHGSSRRNPSAPGCSQEAKTPLASAKSLPSCSPQVLALTLGVHVHTVACKQRLARCWQLGEIGRAHV